MPRSSRSWCWKVIALQSYRLVVIAAIVYLMRRHQAVLQVMGDDPIRVEEARSFFPAAQRLLPDTTERMGMWVLDKDGKSIGYALKTSPVSDKIVGYCGPTDTLVALTPDKSNPVVVGIKVRHSLDTKQHVADVVADEYFMGTWTGKSWDAVAGMDPRTAGIEGVSGASLTSRSIANGIRKRFESSVNAAKSSESESRQWPHLRLSDLGIMAIVAFAIVVTFTGLKGIWWIRRGFQAVLIGYLGLVNGQLLAQSLLAGWASTAVPWKAVPGLFLLLAAALIVPWATRRQLYCSHICPHGAAQEWIGRLAHRFAWRRVAIPCGIDRGLRWLPPMLLGLVLLVTMQNVPFNLAGIEPFDAYVIRTAGVATIVVAVVGLGASLFVPMAYCKYGCPTGAVLSFVRSHGKADRLGRRDLAAGILVLLTYLLSLYHHPLHRWLIG